ncbi:KPN_02809 family neutral zinc metallopeptidase [Novipirellula artificiosorum]|uniref:Putative neutral zinc metallopeptidase n=1 Tax=Novipirellula artificiosorum TaxID=2528016 RepID=A0A5C6DYT8_9BACT|nr:neutral zinc metallopeptidase [Novipirellula artificiosorum]TWU42603.1 putative neutral zinc metallopeptidase [Novipirellula artificiosorum]
MRWRGRRQSENVEDRRGVGGPVAVGGGIGLMIMALLVAFMGGDPRQVMQQAQQGAPAAQGPGGEAELSPEEVEAGEFAKTILADTEDVWTELFRQAGRRYEKPSMVLFSGQVQSACGMASAASGPFYCPADKKLYLDTSFFNQLSQQLGAPGDFAQAYVIAHEVGHHVQNLLGYTDQVEQVRRTQSETQANLASVRLELQADFFAGVMLHHAQRSKDILEPGDIEEGLRAASAIGDDRLQRQSRGYVVPESFTHGTSEQRLRWFMKGLETGDLSQGDTFNADQL